jgi:hypothetical protein
MFPMNNIVFQLPRATITYIPVNKNYNLRIKTVHVGLAFTQNLSIASTASIVQNQKYLKNE